MPLKMSYIKTIKFIIFYPLFLVFSTSCNTDIIIDSDLPNTESKLVLNATFSTFTPPYLSPFKVELLSSLPILDTTTLKPITDATMLWIENDSVIDTLKYNNQVGAYTANEFYFPKIDK